MISVITPIYKEPNSLLKATLEHLLRFKGISQIIVVATKVDPSINETKRFIAAEFGCNQSIDLIITQHVGRAAQMNVGAAKAKNNLLLFLHADSRLPVTADELVVKALRISKWGRFDVQLDDHQFCYSVIAWFINTRSKLSGISTGDQGIFVRENFFKSMSGFPDQDLMEDIEFCKRAKKISPPYNIKNRLTTSARRWQKNGVIKTIVLMWWLRFLYWWGISHQRLSQMYHQVR